MPVMNFFDAELKREGNNYFVELSGEKVKLDEKKTARQAVAEESGESLDYSKYVAVSPKFAVFSRTMSRASRSHLAFVLSIQIFQTKAFPLKWMSAR